MAGALPLPVRGLRDCAAGLLVAIAVVSFWRGVWELIDLHLLPEDDEASSWATVGMGGLVFLVLLAAHYWQRHHNEARERAGQPRAPATGVARWLEKHVWGELWYALAGAATVSFWRGTWYLWDEYVLPDDKEASSVISLAVGFVTLLVTRNLDNTIGAPFHVLFREDGATAHPRDHEPLLHSAAGVGSAYSAHGSGGSRTEGEQIGLVDSRLGGNGNGNGNGNGSGAWPGHRRPNAQGHLPAADC